MVRKVIQGPNGYQPCKVLNMHREDIVNMLKGGVKPTQHDVTIGLANFTGTPQNPEIKWNQESLEKASTGFLLKLYRKRAHRRTIVR